MKRITILLSMLALLFLCGAAWAQGPTFQVCKSTYALCTTATCTETDNPLVVVCACEVRTNEYSLGAQACGSDDKPTPGAALKSRYHPIWGAWAAEAHRAANAPSRPGFPPLLGM